MKYKTLIFGTASIYNKLKPLYDNAVKNGNLQIVAIAELQKDSVNLVYADGKKEVGLNNISDFDLAIISSKNNFYQRMKQLETFGFPRNRIIDGRVFQMPHLDFPRFLEEGIAYGVLEKNTFEADSRMIYPKIYETKSNKVTLSLGSKSYIRKNSHFEGRGLIALDKFCSFATDIFF